MLEIHEDDRLGLTDLSSFEESDDESDEESLTDSRVTLTDAQTEIVNHHLARLRAEKMMADRADISQDESDDESIADSRVTLTDFQTEIVNQ